MVKHGPNACCTQLLVAEEGVWPRLTNLGDTAFASVGIRVFLALAQPKVLLRKCKNQGARNL